MAQQYKIDKVEELTEIFNNNKDYIFNNYTGLSVAKITELRNELRKVSSKFVVIKNNYIRRILEGKELSNDNVDKNLFGPTAVAFSEKDSSEVIKILFNFAKANKLQVKGGIVDSKFFDESQLKVLSNLPSKNQLIAMLMSTMNAPLQNFVFACNDVIGRFVRVVNAVAESKK